MTTNAQVSTASRRGTTWVRRGRRVGFSVSLLAVVGMASTLAPASARGVTWASQVAGHGGAQSGHRAVVDAGIPLDGPPVRVIVQGNGASAVALHDAVKSAGGQVLADLPIVDGVDATVPAHGVGALASSPDIVAITLDRTGQFSGYTFDSTASASNFVGSSGAGQAWAKGLLGDGIGVAVIDTGASNMNDLKGRLAWGPDLSGESSTVDSFGHGTVMAGIIGGNGADSAANPGGAYTGIAPHATIVPVKVAGRNGAVDVSTVLQAMHWVSAYKDQFNIRVLNLSWGTASTQDPRVDPLNYAVERLWTQGIAVAVAVGNSGPKAGTVTKPGDDPMVITVGAYDDKQNADPSDDSVAPWSSQGPTAAGLTKPDVVAPGRYIIASRSLGSNIEQTYPKALRDPSYIRGSGSSEATAVTSGLLALLAQAHPGWTPDQMKAALKNTASPIAGSYANAQGAGRVQLAAALAADPGAATQQTAAAGGLGSLEGSRGGVDLQAICNGQVTLIQGEIDAQCNPWSGTSWTGTSWTGTSWTGTSWTGTSWTGTSWTGGSWTNASWTGTSWTGGSWTGTSWTGTSWTGTSWTGTSWTGTSWTGTSWTGTSWTGTSWTGGSWTGGSWTGAGYDDFLTAFWGNHPPSNKHLAGETSEPIVRVRLA